MAYRHQGNNGYGSNDREMDMRTRGSDRNDGIDKQNTHLIEHLATFTVTRETGIIYPSDGMNRLLQLEQSNGIWSQKMQLCLDHQWVLIMDYETGVINAKNEIILLYFKKTLLLMPRAKWNGFQPIP